MEKSNITVIIPVHTVIDLDKYLPKALESVESNKVLPDEVVIVRCACPEVTEFLNTYDFGNLVNKIRVIETKQTKGFAHMVNSAVSEITTDYFSILEFDDEYSSIWFKNAVKYIKEYSDVDVFLSHVIDVDGNNSFIGTTNEVTWSLGFVQGVTPDESYSNLGFLDLEALKTFPNFQLSGAVIKKSTFEDIGGIKNNIKLSFIYEFLLRTAYNGYKIMTIPKSGYKHMNMRQYSLFWKYRNDDKYILSQNEGKFWMQTALKEYFFNFDREIKYAES
jgi:GT2 family glycosyltransferase